MQRPLKGHVRPGVRSFHGPGNVTGETAKLEGWRIIKEMLRHIWPREQPSLKARVVIALGLLVGAKVFLFHYTTNKFTKLPCSVGECPSAIFL